MKRDFLVSGELLAMIALPQGIAVHAIGEVKLRGKAKPLEVFAMSRSLEDDRDG